MCLTPEEARIVNKAFNAEEYYRLSDSLCNVRYLNLVDQIIKYDSIIGIDVKNSQDRYTQVALWKDSFYIYQRENIVLKKSTEDIQKALTKQTKRKKIWRATTIVGIPLSFAAGVVFTIIKTK
jgi:hypothetical protein